MPINRYVQLCRYSLVFQCGTMTLTLVFVTGLAGLLEYLQGQTPLIWLVAVVSGVVVISCTLVILWTCYLLQRLKNHHSGGVLFWIWILFGLVQWPFGPLLSCFQCWCLWRMGYFRRQQALMGQYPH